MLNAFLTPALLYTFKFKYYFMQSSQESRFSQDTSLKDYRNPSYQHGLQHEVAVTGTMNKLYAHY